MIKVLPKFRSGYAEPFGTGLIAASLPMPLLLVGAAQEIVFVNPAAEQFFDTGAGLLLKQTLAELLPFDSPLFQLIEQARERNSSAAERDVDVSTPRHGERIADVTVTPLPEPEGTLVITLQERSLAQRMDRIAIIRSLRGGVEQHLSDLCVSGWPMSADGRRQGDHPAIGPAAAHLLGPVHPAVPPFVGIAPLVGTIGSNVGEPGVLGRGVSAFRPDSAAETVLDLSGLALPRMQDRRVLLSTIQDLRRDLEADPSQLGYDHHSRQAFELLTSRRVANALDLSREDPRLVARYGRGHPPADPAYAPYFMEQFLIARRLFEVGVRVVTIAFGLWDTHSHNFSDRQGHGLIYSLPRLDQGLSALIDDISARGLDQDLAVVVWGEFGRTPKINKDAGRDHWPAVSMAILAGGGFRTGQVIGSTDRWASSIVDRPIHYQNVFATLYQHLGIDPERTLLSDRLGRPLPLLEHREPIRELIG